MPHAARTANIATKVALGALIAFYLLNPGLEQFSGKVMPLRATLFPVAASLVAIIWWARGRPGPYPHLVDALVTLPTIVDFGGNALGLYSLEWFDHAVHFTNTALLATAVGLALAGSGLPRLAVAGLILGAGSVLHTIWEIVEYHLDVLFDAGLDVTAQTTIRDFMAGLTGAALAALLVATRFSDREDLGGRLLAGRAPDRDPSARGAATATATSQPAAPSPRG